MDRFRAAGWTVVEVALPETYPWGLFPTRHIALIRAGLAPAEREQVMVTALAAMPATDREPSRPS